MNKWFLELSHTSVSNWQVKNGGRTGMHIIHIYAHNPYLSIYINNHATLSLSLSLSLSLVPILAGQILNCISKN